MELENRCYLDTSNLLMPAVCQAQDRLFSLGLEHGAMDVCVCVNVILGLCDS